MTELVVIELSDAHGKPRGNPRDRMSSTQLAGPESIRQLNMLGGNTVPNNLDLELD